jgi:hypothetical protein
VLVVATLTLTVIYRDVLEGVRRGLLAVWARVLRWSPLWLGVASPALLPLPFGAVLLGGVVSVALLAIALEGLRRRSFEDAVADGSADEDLQVD